MSDKLFSYLLKHIEGSPEAKFYESELTGISSAGFAALKKQKHLLFDQYDFESEHYYDKHGNERFVRKVNGKWLATSTEDSGISPLFLSEKDLNRYSFNIAVLLRGIKTKNGLTKNISNISSRIWFIGECISGTRQFGVFLGLFSENDQAEELLGIRSRISQYEYILVLCPTFEISDQGLLSRLEGQKISCHTFNKTIKGGKIDFGIMKDLEKPAVGFVIPDLNATERSKYEKVYPRKDVIEFYDTAKGYFIKINGSEMEFDRIQYGLLIFLAKALKADQNCGKIAVKDAVDENIVRDPQHFYRLSGELNKLMKSFVENKKDKIISTVKGETGVYRLTTMPSRIKQPHTKWLNSKYKTIKGQIAQERQSRGVELNYKV